MSCDINPSHKDAALKGLPPTLKDMAKSAGWSVEPAESTCSGRSGIYNIKSLKNYTSQETYLKALYQSSAIWASLLVSVVRDTRSFRPTDLGCSNFLLESTCSGKSGKVNSVFLISYINFSKPMVSLT